MATRTETFEVDAPTVSVRQISGRVVIEAANDQRTEVVLTGQQAMVDAVEVEHSGREITIAVAKPRRRFGALVLTRDQAVDIHVRIPANTSLRLATVSGDVNVTATCADARYNTVSGDLLIKGGAANVHLNTVSGDVRFDGAFTEMIAKSVSGDMTITTHQGGSLTVSSVSGDIEVLLAAGVAIDIEARSLSGDLNSDIPLASDGEFAGEDQPLRVIGKTVSGDLHIRRATTV